MLIWERLCADLRKLLKDAPARPPAEPFHAYHERLLLMHSERIRDIGSQLRETYESQSSKVRQLKVIGPRRVLRVDGGRVSLPAEPFAAVRSHSSLMKKAKMETISSRAGSAASARLVLPGRTLFPPAARRAPPRA